MKMHIMESEIQQKPFSEMKSTSEMTRETETCSILRFLEEQKTPLI